MDFNTFEKQLSENEMALFICATMVMYSAIEAGASQKSLLARLATHQSNFNARGQSDAARVIQAFSMMVSSTNKT